MPSTAPRRFVQIEAGQAMKVRTVFQLLADNLRPEECDRESPTYRLRWYDNLQDNHFGLEDLEHFRRFVDDMAERATRRSHRTEAIFPSGPATGLNAEGIDLNVLQARSLCESLRAGLDER